MGRKKSCGEKQEKKTPVKLRPIARKHAGKITEPWAIMERLIVEVSHFAHLKVARIKLWWQKDWKADVDGIATSAQVCRASEIDRNVAEEAGAETPDVFIKIAEGLWPTWNESEKEQMIFHELCHVRPAKNANGNQKCDAKDRLLWRIARHPITTFYEEVERYGIDRVLGRNAKILESIAHAERPMEKLFDQAEKSGGDSTPSEAGKNDATAKATAGPEAWRQHRIGAAGFTDKQVGALERADIWTLGELQDAMNRHGQFWPKNTGVSGRMRQAIEDRFNAYILMCGPVGAEAV